MAQDLEAGRMPGLMMSRGNTTPSSGFSWVQTSGGALAGDVVGIDFG